MLEICKFYFWRNLWVALIGWWLELFLDTEFKCENVFFAKREMKNDFGRDLHSVDFNESTIFFWVSGHLETASYNKVVT